jgi:hydrogenase nickel incorporation protein HypB
MCTTCCCGTEHIHINGDILHYHEHDDTVGNHMHHSHAPGISESRRVRIEQAIMVKNNHFAQQNRYYLTKHGIFMLNLVSSPGSGKTTILIETIKALQNEIPIAVIEGDQQTDQDVLRIRATGVPALQINTGKGCHLDAYMVGYAMEKLDLQDNSLLFVENIGNLVCPAAFDLGEAHKVVIFSVTEGEDKPLKYPDMFHAADVMLLNKCDLLPYLSFDVSCAIDYAHRINPALQVIQISATQGSGLQQWIDWVKSGHQQTA